MKSVLMSSLLGACAAIGAVSGISLAALSEKVSAKPTCSVLKAGQIVYFQVEKPGTVPSTLQVTIPAGATKLCRF